MAKARKSSSKKSSGGRGSAEAIEKRRVARQLNALLTDGGSSGPKLDGRTEKRRKRLIKELAEGKRGQELKPAEALKHVDELLALGETLSSLRKQGAKARKFDLSPDVEDAVKKMQAAHQFKAESWKFLGLTVAPDGSEVKKLRGRGPAKKTGAKKATRKRATKK
ncbi:MAG: hypothetical protein AAGH15_23470 [Myxococcota bacterium]